MRVLAQKLAKEFLLAQCKCRVSLLNVRRASIAADTDSNEGCHLQPAHPSLALMIGNAIATTSALLRRASAAALLRRVRSSVVVTATNHVHSVVLIDDAQRGRRRTNEAQCRSLSLVDTICKAQNERQV